MIPNAIDTAMIPVAGLGTRMSPFTEGVHKFMTPVYAGDQARPAIDYMLDECLGVGIRNILFVVSDGGDAQMERYLGPLRDDRMAQLQAQVERDPSKQVQLDKEVARRKQFAGVRRLYVEQPAGPYGTAVPLDLARKTLAPLGIDRFLVTGGDDFIWHADGHSEWEDALAYWDGTASIIMGDNVDPDDASRFGILYSDEQGDLLYIHERPDRKDVPANPVRNISRYIACPQMWPFLDAEMARHPESKQPEHRVTDVISAAIAAGNLKYRVYPITGKYLDCGTARSSLHASNYISGYISGHL